MRERFGFANSKIPRDYCGITELFLNFKLRMIHCIEIIASMQIILLFFVNFQFVDESYSHLLKSLLDYPWM